MTVKAKQFSPKSNPQSLINSTLFVLSDRINSPSIMADSDFDIEDRALINTDNANDNNIFMFGSHRLQFLLSHSFV